MFPLKFLMDNSLYFFLFATYSYQILNRLINFRKEKERKFIQSQIYWSLSMQCFYITSGSHLELEYVGAQYWWGTWGSLNGRFAVHPGTEGVIILCTSLENLSESQTAAEVVLTEAVAWRIVKGQNASFAVIFERENMRILYLKCLLQKLIRL